MTAGTADQLRSSSPNSGVSPAAQAEMSVVRSDRFQELVGRQNRIGFGLTGLTFVCYYGFFLVDTFLPSWFSVMIPVFGTTGILFIVLTFAFVWLIALYYLRVVQHELEPMRNAMVVQMSAPTTAAASAGGRS